MFRLTTALALAGCAFWAQLAEPKSLEVVQHQGISVAFDVLPLDKAVEGNTLRAGDAVSVQFRVEDLNRTGLAGLFPAAWIHPSDSSDEQSDELCLNKTKAFIGGSLLSRAEIDLNVYYVLTLNDDASISVVDPLFGFGGSKLLTMLPLEGIGFDWVVSPSQNYVYVTLPAQNKIVEINTTTWNVIHHAVVSQWKSPSLLSLPIGQRYLWTLVDNGVVVHDLEPFTLKTAIKIPGNPTALAFSTDLHYVFVMDHDYLTVIDAHTFTIATRLKLGDGPVTMDYAALAEELYVAHTTSGDVWVIDGKELTVSKVIESTPGVKMLRFAPDGRLGFMINPVTDQLFIIDAARQKIVQSGRVADEPDYIAFSEQLVYIRHRNNSDLLMVALDDRGLGRDGADIQTIDTPGGDRPAGLIDVPSGGEGIVQAPGSSAVLISNYHDKAVYFYKEGMAAPMGQFSNYGKSPRSVLAVDHSLKERTTTGTYSTSTVLPHAGHYEAIFFMDSPRVVHCFSFDVAASTEEESQSTDTDIVITKIADTVEYKVGKTAIVAFRALRKETGTPILQGPIEVSIILASGMWSQQLAMDPDHEGHISVKFVPPLPGTYYMYVSIEDDDNSNITEKFSYDVSR